MSAAQILVSAAVPTAASFIVVLVYARWSRGGPFDWLEAVVPALVVGLSILLWRAAGNTQSLNDDPIPLVSPNDVLCPMLTYVGLGLYAAVRKSADDSDVQRV